MNSVKSIVSLWEWFSFQYSLNNKKIIFSPFFYATNPFEGKYEDQIGLPVK